MYLELDAVFNNDGESIKIDYEFLLEDECIVTPVQVPKVKIMMSLSFSTECVFSLMNLSVKMFFFPFRQDSYVKMIAKDYAAFAELI